MSDPAADLARFVAGRELHQVRLHLDQGLACLHLDGGEVAFRRVHSGNLLGPWDGTPGRVEWLALRRRDAGFLFLELRVRYPEVPRNYRMVCGEVTWQEDGGGAGRLSPWPRRRSTAGSSR